MSALPSAAEVGRAETNTSENPRPLEALDETQLLAHAQIDPSAAFEEIYSRHLFEINNYISSIVGRRKAEDISQELFLRVWVNLGKIEERGSGIRAWLFRTAHNLCADEYRRASIRHTTFELFPDEEEVIAEDANETAAIIGKLTVIPLLGRFKPDQVREIVAIDIVGIGMPEYAKAANITVAALKSRLHRHRQELRQDPEVQLLVA